ncbi:putative ankyrin repeat and fibronectin type-III domain-containing protein [Plasmopara halstedii]
MCSADFTGKTFALDAQETYEYQLTTGLETGVLTHIRITSQSSLGFGPPSDSMSVAPITSSETPPSPYVTLSALRRGRSRFARQFIALSFLSLAKSLLDVSGGGGSPETKLLVEWIDT